MKSHLRRGLTLFIAIILAFPLRLSPPVQAQSSDTWWDSEWPYRIAVEVNEPGPASVNLNFTQLFSDLGLVDALLDLQSIRVIPMISGTPGDPIPFQETYSTLFFDGELLNTDSSSGEPYWHAEYQIKQTLDEIRFTEGAHAIKSTILVQDQPNILSDFIYYFNGSPFTDWSQFESFTYDLWPEVNQAALDQSPNLFQFELLGLGICSSNRINSPGLALNQWNSVTVPLKYFGGCATPDTSALTGIRFMFMLDAFGNQINNYDPGDQVTLWQDNFRLVDQDGEGEIRWIAEPGIDTYYIYFDTFNHSGHADPTLSDGPIFETQAVTINGSVEAGGYFHQITGANPAGFDIWTAPITEKILKGQSVPIIHHPLEIKAAKDEYEALQLIVRSPIEQTLPVSISDLSQGEDGIPASAVQIFRVDYVTITRLSDEYGRLTEWPDPLYPISSGQGVSFPADENQPLWFRIKIPENTPEGQYSGEIHIGAAAIPFSLTVWDFTLVPGSGVLPFFAGLDLDTLVEAYGGTVQGEIHPCYGDLIETIAESLETYNITPLPPNTAPSPGLVYNLTSYPQEEAHQTQLQTGEKIWWSFTAYDRPAFANPAIIDRPGQDARILPWMAWADRVDGLYYHKLADWGTNPWEEPFTNNLANGDGFLFYPPKDDTVGTDPCNPDSNRLIPSIRLELLREGLEDYAYLLLLNGTPPAVDQTNPSDSLVAQILSSRTLYRHIPPEYDILREELISQIVTRQPITFIPLLMFTH